ncbi:MAG: N-acetylglucosamine-6-phosphate deacetylase [bacterium]
MNTVIKNCHLISPDLEREGASIEIEGSFIKNIYTSGDPLPATGSVYNAEGGMVMPGFIDIHCHGLAGFDVSDGSVSAIEHIAKGKVKEGVTTMTPTTLSQSPEHLITIMNAVASFIKKTHLSAKITGVHLEGPYINPRCAGAQNLSYIRKPDRDEVLRLSKIAPISIISCAPELEGGLEFIRMLCSENILPSCAHSAATYAQFKEAKKAGLRQFTHYCNQMSGLHHRQIGLIGAGLLDDDTGVEIICDRIHLCPEMIELIFKVKPIEKIMLITDSTSASGCDDGIYTMGGLEVKLEKGSVRLVSNGTLAGSTVRFNTALKNAYEITTLSLTQLVKTTSLNQAYALGLKKTGKLEPGYYADIVILNHEFVPTTVFVNGEPIKVSGR